MSNTTDPANEYVDTSTCEVFRMNYLGAYAETPRPAGYINTTTGELFETTCEAIAFLVEHGRWIGNDPALECLDGPGGCRGPVEYRSVDGLKAWPRCEGHFADRLELQERTAAYTGDCAPEWFDESYAGERWDEDY